MKKELSLNKPLLTARANIFKSLAHPTRLFIIEKLAKRECCVCEFVNEVGVDFSTISKHLSVLKNAGIISDEKRGQQVFYRLEMSCVAAFNQCVDKFLATGSNPKIQCHLKTA